MAGFEPQTDVQVVSIPCDMAWETTPTMKEFCLLTCPDNANMQLELLSVGFVADTLPIDSTDLHVDVEFIDDSDGSDTATDLVENYDVEVANATAAIYNEMWRGSQIMDAGDVINAEVTSTSPSTASEGAAFIVEFRVLRHS